MLSVLLWCRCGGCFVVCLLFVGVVVLSGVFRCSSVVCVCCSVLGRSFCCWWCVCCWCFCCFLVCLLCVVFCGVCMCVFCFVLFVFLCCQLDSGVLACLCFSFCSWVCGFGLLFLVFFFFRLVFLSLWLLFFRCVLWCAFQSVRCCAGFERFSCFFFFIFWRCLFFVLCFWFFIVFSVFMCFFDCVFYVIFYVSFFYVFFFFSQV